MKRLYQLFGALQPLRRSSANGRQRTSGRLAASCFRKCRLLAHRVGWRSAAAGLESGAEQKSSRPVRRAAFDPNRTSIQHHRNNL
jgi:hypothetical protein